MRYEPLPRYSLGFFPTPLVKLSRLTERLSGPHVFMKRDDQTGLALGGNKVRKLEFLVGEAGRSRPIDGPDQGFTLFTAGIALQVAGEGLGFEEGLRYVVSLGGDTDTNAAVAGALLGAAHGGGAIPSDWVARLATVDELTSEADAVAALL